MLRVPAARGLLAWSFERGVASSFVSPSRCDKLFGYITITYYFSGGSSTAQVKWAQVILVQPSSNTLLACKTENPRKPMKTPLTDTHCHVAKQAKHFIGLSNATFSLSCLFWCWFSSKFQIMWIIESQNHLDPQESNCKPFTAKAPLSPVPKHHVYKFFKYFHWRWLYCFSGQPTALPGMNFLSQSLSHSHLFLLNSLNARTSPFKR